MKNTRIVLISVHYNNSKDVAEEISGKTFTTDSLLLKELESQLQGDEEEESLLIYSLADFMDGVNTQELDVLDGYFMSYVNIEE